MADIQPDQALRKSIDRSFPAGRFVAIDEDQVIADAATFDELTDVLRAIGKDSPEVFVVQAGSKAPDFLYILPIRELP